MSPVGSRATPNPRTTIAIRNGSKIIHKKHDIVPLTERGRIMTNRGGMVLLDKNGRRIEADRELRLGDIIFYDASFQHGVERIVPFPARPIGRLQMFSVPVTLREYRGECGGCSMDPD